MFAVGIYCYSNAFDASNCNKIGKKKEKNTKNPMRNDEKTIPEKGHLNFESARVLMNEMKWNGSSQKIGYITIPKKVLSNTAKCNAIFCN